MKNNCIGIFDSGIGGATVLKEIIKLLPNENYIYYSDSKNNPYGDKSNKEIINICDNIVKYLKEERKCKIIVIACNTASAKSVEFLRNKYKDISFIAIEPAYKMVHDYSYNTTTLVMATKGTIESEKFKLLYNKYNNDKTFLCPCIGLADIIENGDKEQILKYLNDNIIEYKGKVKNVVLGCTHYPLIKNEIQEVLGKVKFFDGSPKLAIHVKEILEKKNLLSTKNKEMSIEFIDTSKEYKQKEIRFFYILGKSY